jgi:radical SAM superfamily enzyme YgiQ (UPF0313 family)
MADAVLVNPKGFKLINDQNLPFALLYASAYAQKEFDIKIIDSRVDKDWKIELLKELKKNPKVVALTSMTGPQILDALEISRLAKEKSSAKVVWGGIHASLLPEQTIQNKYIDIIVQYEGEITFYELLKALSKNTPLSRIKGIWYKEDGKIKKNPERRFLTNLDEIPPLPYHLLDIKKYFQIKESYDNRKSLTVLTSRGCPNACTYCFNAKFNKSCWRGMSAERSLEEMNYVIGKFNLRNILFTDDNFFVNPKRVAEIAKGIIREGWDLTWEVLGATIGTLDRADKDYLELLQKSGCTSLLIGIESGSQKMLDQMKKGITVEQVLRVNKKLSKTRMKALYSFMSGFPHETSKDIMDTINLIFKLEKDNKNIDTGTIKPLVCYPGTRVYDLAVSLGYQPPKKLEDWADVAWCNYLNLDYPWLSAKRKNMLVNLYYYSLLSTPNYIHINSKLFTMGARILRPVVLYRMKHLNFSFPLTAKLMRFIQEHFV